MGTKAELNARVAGFLGRKRPSQPINDELNTRINERYQRIVSARNIAKTNIRRLTTPKYETVDGAEDF